MKYKGIKERSKMTWGGSETAERDGQIKHRAAERECSDGLCFATLIELVSAIGVKAGRCQHDCVSFHAHAMI